MIRNYEPTTDRDSGVFKYLAFAHVKAINETDIFDPVNIYEKQNENFLQASLSDNIPFIEYLRQRHIIKAFRKNDDDADIYPYTSLDHYPTLDKITTENDIRTYIYRYIRVGNNIQFIYPMCYKQDIEQLYNMIHYLYDNGLFCARTGFGSNLAQNFADEISENIDKCRVEDVYITQDEYVTGIVDYFRSIDSEYANFFNGNGEGFATQYVDPIKRKPASEKKKNKRVLANK